MSENELKKKPLILKMLNLNFTCEVGIFDLYNASFSLYNISLSQCSNIALFGDFDFRALADIQVELVKYKTR